MHLLLPAGVNACVCVCVGCMGSWAWRINTCRVSVACRRLQAVKLNTRCLGFCMNSYAKISPREFASICVCERECVWVCVGECSEVEARLSHACLPYS